MNFSFEKYDDHIIALIDAQHVIIDTGSPVTIGRSGTGLPSFGNPRIGTGLGGTGIEEISRLLGCPIDILLGTDVIGNQPFLVDWKRETITFAPGEVLSGAEIALDDIMGVPVVSAFVNGRTARLAVDTGAKATYLNSRLVSDGEVVGSYDDFFLTFGPFTCRSYRTRIEIGDVEFEVAAGEIPAGMENVFLNTGLDGIVGNDIFKHFLRVLYDLPNRCLVLGGPVTDPTQ